MRIFITGGTGYLGAAIVRATVGAGHEVTALARSDAADAAARALGVAATVRGEAADVATLAAAARTHDASLHVAAIGGPDRPQIDRGAIEALIAGARAAEQPRTVVYTSGLWTLGVTGDAAADETTPAERPPAISRFRVALERDVVAAGGGDVVTTVVRPGMCWGRAEGVAAWLLRWLPDAAGRAHDVVSIGDGGYRWSPVHVDDVARLYLAILAQRAGGMFHAMEPTPVRVGDAARAFSALALRPYSPWPRAQAEQTLGAGLVEAMTMDQVVRAPRSESVLGWRPQRELARELDAAWREFSAG